MRTSPPLPQKNKPVPKTPFSPLVWSSNPPTQPPLLFSPPSTLSLTSISPRPDTSPRTLKNLLVPTQLAPRSNRSNPSKVAPPKQNIPTALKEETLSERTNRNAPRKVGEAHDAAGFTKAQRTYLNSHTVYDDTQATPQAGVTLPEQKNWDDSDGWERAETMLGSLTDLFLGRVDTYGRPVQKRLTYPMLESPFAAKMTNLTRNAVQGAISSGLKRSQDAPGSESVWANAGMTLGRIFDPRHTTENLLNMGRAIATDGGPQMVDPYMPPALRSDTASGRFFNTALSMATAPDIMREAPGTVRNLSGRLGSKVSPMRRTVRMGLNEAVGRTPLLNQQGQILRFVKTPRSKPVLNPRSPQGPAPKPLEITSPRPSSLPAIQRGSPSRPADMLGLRTSTRTSSEGSGPRVPDARAAPAASAPATLFLRARPAIQPLSGSDEQRALVQGSSSTLADLVAFNNADIPSVNPSPSTSILGGLLPTSDSYPRPLATPPAPSNNPPVTRAESVEGSSLGSTPSTPEVTADPTSNSPNSSSQESQNAAAQRVQVYRAPLPGQHIALANLPEYLQRRLMLPDYALTEEEAYQIAVDLVKEFKVVRSKNTYDLLRRSLTTMYPPSQRVTDVRNNYNTRRSGFLMPFYMEKALREDWGLNLLAYDRQEVGLNWITGRYGQGGLGNYGENGLANLVATAHRFGDGQNALERSTTGKGAVSQTFKNYFYEDDQPRLASLAKGEANVIGIGTSRMHWGNVLTPSLFLSTLHPYAWGLRSRAHVRAINQAVSTGLEMTYEKGINLAARELAKQRFPNDYVKARNKTAFARGRFVVPGFQKEVEIYAARNGYVFDPENKPDLRRILQFMPFSTFPKRRAFVETVDSYLQKKKSDFPSLEVFADAQSAYPADIYGEGAGRLIGITVNDLRNPTGVPAMNLGVPTTTSYELLTPGALAGRPPYGHYFDYRAEVPDSRYPGMIPLWSIARKLRPGARDVHGNLILGKSFEELSPQQSMWTAVSGNGPFFLAEQDKPAMSRNMEKVMEQWQKIQEQMNEYEW